jgi:hypothetical protein
VFIGHFAVAFAAKRAAPTVSLGTWFIACELVDLVWPLFLLFGIETVRITPGITAFTPLDFVSYPWTHSLLMCALWALAMGAIYWALRQDTVDAIVIGMSHWFLDAIVHRPDLPLAPGSDVKIGFDLWDSVAGTLTLESAMFVAAVWFYMAGSRARDRIGEYGFIVIVALLVISYVSAAFGPVPPSVAAIAWVGLAGGFVFGALGYWVDRHREVRK